ncbi:Galactose-3-O-sulfotransferase 3 [Mactra antiquata]
MHQKVLVLKTCKPVFWIAVVGVLIVVLITSTQMREFAFNPTSGPYLDTTTINQPNVSLSNSRTTSDFKLSQNVYQSHINETSESSLSREEKMKTNIAFLKVHKAGSTTMQNLFFRFGIRHNLNVLLPMKGNFIRGNNKNIPLEPSQTYNIHACHSIYKKSFFMKLIPNNPVFIGIIREPVDRIVSAAYYYRDIWNKPYLKRIPAANFIHNLIRYPEKYEETHYSRTRNSMGWDFGIPQSVKRRDTKFIQTYLEQLNSDFALVMVAEKFDESLVMMKRLLSWSFLDIIYLKSNTHVHKPVVLNEDERAKSRETNFLDFAIYDYFSKIFENKTKSMDNDFDGEVKRFKEILSEVSTFCSDEKTTDNSKLFIPQSKWDSEFTLPGVECTMMKTAEIKFINQIREKKLQELKTRWKG